MTQGRNSARLKPLIGTTLGAVPLERRAGRRAPAVFKLASPAAGGAETLEAFRSAGDGIYRTDSRRPWLRTLLGVGTGTAAFVVTGAALAAEVESVFIGLIGACILFLIAVSIVTSLGGSSARGR